MTKAKCAFCILAGLAILMLLPSMAMAQSAISGVVKDSSGAVVANATVQAASDVLIEGQRTVTTNAEGRYEIVDLRPGTYTVTVTMQGFNTVKQTILVPANVTVPVDAELKVGAVGETVNVEARVATVDVENAAHPETLSRSEMDDVPTGRYMQSIASYAPGAHLNLPDIGGSQQIEQNYISVHGNGSVHDVYMLDGMIANTNYADGQIQNYIDNAMIAETTLQNSNVTAEVSGGGMLTNLVPKEGGNQFHGQMYAGGTDGSWQSNNIDANLTARGLTGQDAIAKIEDFDGSFGGPIIHDKLWFLLTGREQTTFTQAANSTYPNGAPGIQDGGIYAGSLRFTYQATAKHKFSIFETRNWKYKNHEILDGGQTGIPADPSTAATRRNRWPMYYILQGKWTGALTPKLIAEAGVTIDHLDYNDLYQPGIAQAPFTPAWYQGTSDYDITRNARYVAGFLQQQFQTTRNTGSGNLSYITGSHQFKFGVQVSGGRAAYGYTSNGDGWQEFLNGVPFAFLAFNTPIQYNTHLDADLGVYAQDTWHLKRLSLTYGVRFEYLGAHVGEEVAPAGRWVGPRNFAPVNCSNTPGLGCWKDWAPRLGAVYDLFGNHKTALKAGFGKYNTPWATGFTNNFNPMALVNQSLFWNGGSAACEPTCFSTGSYAAPGTPNSAVPLGGIGANPNPSFGQVPSQSLDPNWHREYNYQYSAGLQQELANGVTLNFNWYRRADYQQTDLINYAVPASAWTEVQAINPLNGAPLPIFNLNRAFNGVAPALHQTNDPQSLARNTYTGWETSVLARLSRGAFVMFGWTMDRQLDRSCAESAGTASSRLGNPINDPNTLRFCDWTGDTSLLGPGGINVASLGAVPSIPWAQEFKAQGSYRLPLSIVAGASLYSSHYQGSAFNGSGTTGTTNNGFLARTISVTSTTRYPADCAACPQDGVNPALKAFIDPNTPITETLQLVAPGTVRTDRLNQLDVSFKRTFRFRDKWVLEPEAQIFNILNSNAAVTQATSVSGSVAPFLTGSQCQGSSLKNCGVGGAVTTLTNPRVLRLALLFRF
ncbi:MAG TPA: carboxypeptidase regulatory-like domain-containing protein [Bryobacteraceae bacterium]|nr:carboxypeptidase regulatory-like domain-containing protein [Bryobacteraceae bacterium]